MYWSVYEAADLTRWAAELRALPRSTQAWCIFDNTAGSGAAANALQLARLPG
jgi:uncharacterized protein YecE (DUF72 family)